MRRTAGGFLHPAIRWKLGEQGLERLVADGAGIMRVAESGTFADYMPVEPDLDITSYHEQIDFNDARDVDISTQWFQTYVDQGSNQQRLAAVDWTGRDQPHATMQTGRTLYDYLQYQRRTMNYYPATGGDNSLWFLTRLRLTSRDGDAYVGHSAIGEAVRSSPADGYGFYYISAYDTWYFKVDRTDDSGQSSVLYDLGEGSSDWLEMSMRIRYQGESAIVDIVFDGRSSQFVLDADSFLPVFDAALHMTFGVACVTDSTAAGLHLQFLKVIVSK